MDGKDIPCLLVENKSDLLPSDEVDKIIGLKEFSRNNNFLACFRTSAKTGYNIEESMSYLIENIIQRMGQVSSNNIFSPERNSAILNPGKNEKVDSFRIEQKKECC